LFQYSERKKRIHGKAAGAAVVYVFKKLSTASIDYSRVEDE
jgi:hypothetical protein